LEYLEDTNVVYPKKMEHPRTERRGEERDTKKQTKEKQWQQKQIQYKRNKTNSSLTSPLPPFPPTHHSISFLPVNPRNKIVP